MNKAFPRTRRVGEQIRRELVELMRDELQDPRIALVSITAVDVSRDLAYAKVYVTLLADPAERAEVLAILNQAAALLRRDLGRRMHIRTVPRLAFHYDEAVERGARLSSLITEAVAADAARHQDEATEDTDPAGSH